MADDKEHLALSNNDTDDLDRNASNADEVKTVEGEEDVTLNLIRLNDLMSTLKHPVY